MEKFLTEWHNDNNTVEVCTSGSTGTPKVMHVEKRRMLASAAITCDYLGLHEGNRALLCLSTDYIAGKMMVVRAEYAGMQLDSVPPSGHPLADIGNEVYDLVAMVPMQVYNTLSVPEEAAKLSNIRNLIIGGGAIDPALEAELKHLPNAIWSTYGMTETLSHIALRRINGPETDEWYTPMRGVEVSIDEESRLVIHAPAVCNDRLITNDIAEIDGAKGRFRILGRIDNVICCGGVKIQIEEVERKLSGHMKCDFMVTSKSDSKFGEIPVMLYNGVNESLLRQICDSLLPKYLRPKVYIKVSQLPQTPNGKPARAEAKKIAEQS